MHGCFYRDARGKVQLIIKGGDALPGHPGVTVDDKQPTFDPIVSRDGRFVLVQTVLTRPAVNKPGGEAALLFDTRTGKLTTVAYVGMSAPAPHQAVTFERFSDVMFNAAGQVAFQSMDAVWAGKPGELKRVVAEGNALTIGDRTLNPQRIALAGSGRGGDGAAMNDAGQLVVGFADQGQGDVLVLFKVE